MFKTKTPPIQKLLFLQFDSSLGDSYFHQSLIVKKWDHISYKKHFTIWQMSKILSYIQMSKLKIKFDIKLLWIQTIEIVK